MRRKKYFRIVASGVGSLCMTPFDKKMCVCMYNCENLNMNGKKIYIDGERDVLQYFTNNQLNFILIECRNLHTYTYITSRL